MKEIRAKATTHFEAIVNSVLKGLDPTTQSCHDSQKDNMTVAQTLATSFFEKVSARAQEKKETKIVAENDSNSVKPRRLKEETLRYRPR